MVRFRSFLRDETGGPAAEMALMLPMVMALLFGGMESGNFFWREHQVLKVARETARFASRQPLNKFTNPCGTVEPATETLIQNLAIGALGDGTTVTVTPSCTAGVQGMYADEASGAPVVAVSIIKPYRSLFFNLAFPGAASLTLNARSQAAVMGL